MATNVQLAVQGGGAKLCDLLAVMQAAQAAERAGLIRVTRLAGSSAGSIAAALFAAGVDIERLRDQIAARADDLQRLVPEPSVWMLPQVLRGRPAVNPDPLREVLARLLLKHKVTHFKDLKVPLVVLTSDLTNAGAHPHYDREANVASAVTDSCALPFYFRGPGRKGDSALLVDGGVCENFPVDVLLPFEAEDGEVLGVSFQPVAARPTPASVWRLGVALLDTAIENSVRRAQRQLEPERLLLLPSDMGTFDFARTLTEGISDRYNLRVREAADFFTKAEAYVAARTPAAAPAAAPAPPPSVVVESGAESLDSAVTLQRHADLYAAQHAHHKMAYEELRLLFRLRSLGTTAAGLASVPVGNPLGAPGAPRVPDTLAYWLKFRAFREPLQCIRIGVYEEPGAQFLKTLRTAVLDISDRSRATIDLLGRDRRTPNRRDYLLFLNPPIAPDDADGPFVLDYTHQVTGLMPDLASEGVDTLSVTTNRASGVTPHVLLLAVLPTSRPGYAMRVSPDTTSRDRGRPLTPDEVRRAAATLALEPDEYRIASTSALCIFLRHGRPTQGPSFPRPHTYHDASQGKGRVLSGSDGHSPSITMLHRSLLGDIAGRPRQHGRPAARRPGT